MGQSVSPDSLAGMFQTSLEPPLLSSLLDVLLSALRSDNSSKVQAAVRSYMLGLETVPRFNTVVLFMNKQEKAAAKEIWESLEGDGSLRPAWR
jgi:hypothetical protein